jgi:cell division protein FtsI/penicillin-binding protein 2
MVSRLTVLIAFFALLYSGLVFHLYQLQVERGDYYVARAASLHGAGEEYTRRGSIYFTDKNGNKVPAVSNKDFPTVYAVPKTIVDPEGVATALAPLFNKNQTTLAKSFSNTADLYELLGRKVDQDIADKVEAMNLKGVYVSNVSERYYPFGKLAAHVLGYVGPSDTGISTTGHYGVEEADNSTLSGGGGQDGDPLTLTIDPNIQLEAERILQNLITDKKAKSGSIVVEDPKTGKILTMTSFPVFDPNDYSGTSIRTFLNPATQEVYEPGSVFKVITMAAGIDSGAITPQTTYNDTGELKLNGATIHNWDLSANGIMTMTNVIEKSLNTGAAFAEMRTGNATFLSYLKKFGFGEKTGIDLLGEAKGNLSGMKDRAPAIAYATASFGQGVAVSTIELANAFSAIANGGTLMRPYVNADMKPEAVRTVISKDTADKVTGMMVSALTKAQVGHVNGFSLAGKTGTAQIPDSVNGGYYEGKVLDTYAGFGPTSDPRFVIIVKLMDPDGAPLAGATVVPAFRELAQFILNYYHLTPDDIHE